MYAPSSFFLSVIVLRIQTRMKSEKSSYLLLNKFEFCLFSVALLSGARNVKNNSLSQQVYDRMKKLFPESQDPLISASILLANVYASTGDIDKASDIRNQSGVKKKIGLSSTVINGQLYVSLYTNQ